MEAVLYYLKQAREALDNIVNNRNRRYAHLDHEFYSSEQGNDFRERTSDCLDLQEKLHYLIQDIETKIKTWADAPPTNPPE